MTDTVHYDMDPQLRVEFVDAALESLTGLGNLFVQLEAEPGRLETVEAIFRVMHSIKGNAAFFELMKVQVLAHECETLLDRIRKGQVAPTRATIDTLLAAVDALAAMLARAREGRAEIEEPAEFEAILSQLAGAGQSADAGQEGLWCSLLDALHGMGECRSLEGALDLAGRALQAALQLSAGSGGGGGVPAATQATAALWPASAARLRDLLASGGAQEVFDDARAAKVGALLEEVRDCIDGDKALAIFDEANGYYRLFLDKIGVDPVLREILSDALIKVATLGAWKASPAAGLPLGDENALGEGSAAPAAKTMRVSEESIDGFLCQVGDLDGIGETYRRLQTRLAAAAGTAAQADEMRQVNEALAATADRLRRSIGEIRKMPLHTLLQGVPRIVRDIAAPAGKEIQVRVAGEQVLVDKSIVDTLEAPLVHLVRNAADHGIEPPEARQAAGKPRAGLIEVAASETPDRLVLSVRDDGRGIDFAALRRQAVALGAAPADRELTETETVGLLFKSGVTTAQRVTETSGRGVGMDVVRRSVDAMGGKISVVTEAGRGSTFTIELPKTADPQSLADFPAPAVVSARSLASGVVS